MPSRATSTLPDFLRDEESEIDVLDVELELHGIFWFHTYAQPRDKYVHVSLPVIHNYPIMLALLGRPVESSYVSVSGKITRAENPSKVWKEHGFYVYPAIGRTILIRTLLFSMGDSGHMTLKTKTRAPVPDLATNQVYLPGSIFKTFILVKHGASPKLPGFIRMGAKRYGVFQVKIERRITGVIKEYVSGLEVSHPYNAEDCPSRSYYGILRHYAGNIALTGVPERIIQAGNIVLASPSFV